MRYCVLNICFDCIIFYLLWFFLLPLPYFLPRCGFYSTLTISAIGVCFFFFGKENSALPSALIAETNTRICVCMKP